jgi:hypothetical protein
LTDELPPVTYQVLMNFNTSCNLNLEIGGIEQQKFSLGTVKVQIIYIGEAFNLAN